MNETMKGERAELQTKNAPEGCREVDWTTANDLGNFSRVGIS